MIRDRKCFFCQIVKGCIDDDLFYGSVIIVFCIAVGEAGATELLLGVNRTSLIVFAIVQIML